MPTEVQTDKKKSPYTQKLRRPESGSKSSETKSDSKPKSARARSPIDRKSSPGRRHKKKRGKDELEKEIDLVSKEVKRKLELYMNKEKRQNRFNVGGHSTTTHKMAEFDIAYKLLEYDKLERTSPRNPKTKGQDRPSQRSKTADPYDIQPKLKETSRRVTGYSEADRLSKYASEVFSSYPVEKLAQIHRYRPHPKDNAKSVELGNILGYSGHVGAALQQQNYVDFYIREGLDSVDSRQSARRQVPTKSKEPKKKSKETPESSKKKHCSGTKQHKKKQTKQDKDSDPSEPIENGKDSASSEESVVHNVKDDDNATSEMVSEEGEPSQPDKSEDADQISSSSNESLYDKQRAERRKKDQESREEVMRKSRETLKETWAYFERGSKNDEPSTVNQEGGIRNGKDRTKDQAEDGYTYSDDENNNIDENDKDGNLTDKSGSGSSSDDENIDLNQKGGEKRGIKDSDSVMVRSYSSVEHVQRMSHNSVI